MRIAYTKDFRFIIYGRWGVRHDAILPECTAGGWSVNAIGYKKSLADTQGFNEDTKYKIRTYDPIRVKDVLYH